MCSGVHSVVGKPALDIEASMSHEMLRRCVSSLYDGLPGPQEFPFGILKHKPIQHVAARMSEGWPGLAPKRVLGFRVKGLGRSDQKGF